MLVVAVVGTIAAVVSALGVIAVGVNRWRRRHKLREREARDREAYAAIGAMDDKIERLASVVEALAEEAQARRPQLTVRFLTNDGPSPSAFVVKAAVPSVDLDAILASEREAALATLLPISDVEAEVAQTGLFGLARTAGLGFGGMGTTRFLPVTQEDHDKYRAQVETYLRAVSKFVDAWLSYLAQRQQSPVMRVQIDNDGGAPADQARLRLHFPDPCFRLDDWPEKPERPYRLKFQRRGNAIWSLGHGGGLRIPPVLPIRPINLEKRTGPFYEDGSVNVRFNYEAIPHHDPVSTEHFIVGVPEPGIYKVEWTLGAANLARPESGVLHLEMQHGDTQTEPVATLAALLNAGRTASAPGG